MKRLAICIALGLVAVPFTGCDKGKDSKSIAPGEDPTDSGKGQAGDRRGSADLRDQGARRDDGRGNDEVAVATVADGMKYIPDGANLLIGLDAVKLFDSAVLKDNQDLLTHGEAGEVIAAAEACKVGMSTWKYAVVGGNTEEDQEVVVVMSATDLGTKDTLECIGKKVIENDPQDRFEVGEEDGRVVVSGGIDGQKMYAVSDDVVALVGADWLEIFEDLLDGKGKTALEGSLRDVLASVDQSKHIYFGMTATAEMREGATETLQHVTGTVYLSAGVSIALWGEFADSAVATAVASQATTQFDQMKGMAGALGIPQGVVESVNIEAKGAAVGLSMSAAGNDLEQLSEMIRVELGVPSRGAPAQN